MRTIGVNSWDEFETKIKELEERYGKKDVFGVETKNNILYRGQAKAAWELETTLERYSSRGWSVNQYVELVWKLSPQIKSYNVGVHGEIPSREELKKELAAAWHRLSYDHPYRKYLAHLRHHGFPSPLLDWTKSPYIAAFFAMGEQNGAKRASVFVFVEQPNGGKSGTGDPKIISVIESSENTGKRHDRQKSCYSICTQSKDGEVRYSCHEDVLAEDRTDQDLLYKIKLPRALRLDFLERLNEKDINAFTLFDTEDARMKTLAISAIELAGP